MEFIRTFHPVGQGAFFTEDFFNPEDGYNSTIVYDCGTISSRKILYNEIEEFKKKQEKKGNYPFNLLFISHFDADHVNGLKRLLEKDIADNAYINKIVKDYDEIDISKIEDLIKDYLLMKYPNDNDCIQESPLKYLFKKYSIDKSLVKKIIDKYAYSLNFPHRWIKQSYDIDDNPDLPIYCSMIPRNEYYFDEFQCIRDVITDVIKEQNEKEKRKHIAVIVPFIYPHLIKVLLPEMKNELSEETYDALDALFQSGIKIIGMDYNEFSGNSFDIYGSINKEDLYEDDVRTIKNYQKIVVRDPQKGKECWYYMPYNTIVDEGQVERFLVELVLAMKESKGEIGKWFTKNGGNIYEINNNKCIEEIKYFLMNGVSNLLTDPDAIDDMIKLLRRLYKSGFSGIKGVTVSAINVNSLNVLSFSSNELKRNVLNEHCSFDSKILGRFFHKSLKGRIKKADSSQVYDYNEHMRFYNYSCLYTGDCVMEDHFFDSINCIYKIVLRKSTIGLIQIPHHGSQHNFSNRIESLPIFSSFVNHEISNRYTFAKDIYSLANDKPCFEVTQEGKSRFEQIVIWQNH